MNNQERSEGEAMSEPHVEKIGFAPGYYKGPDGDEYVRLLSPYMGEMFSTLDEAKAWVAEEEHDRYMQITYFEVRPVAASSGGVS